MTMRQLEAEILAEAKAVTGNKKLRQKDIMEWSTGEVKPEEGETLYRLPKLKINISVKLPAAKEKKPKEPKAKKEK